MSFLKKYKKMATDAQEKYMPKEKEESKPEGEAALAPVPAASPVPETKGLTPAVPPGWEANWEESGNRWSYHEQATGKLQHEHPDPANYAGQSMPPGGPVIDDKDGKPKKDKNGMLLGAAGGLATGAFGKKLMGHAKKKAMKQAGMKKSKGAGGEKSGSRSSSSSSSSSEDGGDE